MKKFLLSLLLFVFSIAFALGQADAGKGAEKISATLRAQIAAKNDYVAAPMSDKFKSLKEMGLQEANNQIIFLHFKKKPTQKQIKSLARLGVEVFSDSWIPPVGNHSTGYMTAKIPINKINRLAKKSFVTKLETAERILAPQNDEAATSIKADEVWDNFGWTGSGVKIAVLDSGLDTTHDDIPEPIASEDYSNYPNLDEDIENQVTGHGTHVAGSAVGRGILSNGKYKGIAHGADLIFLKIGDDSSSGASFSAMTAAIMAAVDDYGADIINISYGGFDSFKDGSDEICQAVDYAKSKGVIVFAAAGNEGARQKHYSGTVRANSETDYLKMDVAGYVSIDMNWFDGLGVSNDLHMKLFDADKQEISIYTFRDSESSRGTELEVLSVFVSTGSYYIKVENNSNNDQFFHLYSLNSWVTFDNADADYTVQTPALADGAVAVASYTTRLSWTNYLGDFYDFGGLIGEISSFSSRGPRIDGEKKPSVAAPGDSIISARDKIQVLGGADYLIIDNDGTNDGNGPADYMVLQGTSMSAPVVAGGAALLMQANPSFKGDPDGLLDLMQKTASKGNNWDNLWGYGKINLLAALEAIPSPTPSPSPTPEITPSPTPTETSVPTPVPSPTIEPTPIIPPTPLPSPTETPAPTPIPSPTITVTPTPIPTVEPTLVIPPTPIPTPTTEYTPEPPPNPSPTPTIADEGGGGVDEPFSEGFEVQYTVPENEAVDVETDTVIKVIYNQSINGDPLALDKNGSKVEFRVEGTEVNLPVTLYVRYPDTNKLIITPSEPLESGTTYTLKIFLSGIKAANNGGTQMDNDFTMKLTTKYQ